MAGALPVYPDPRERESLYAIVGEIHHADTMEPSLTPRWCEIPERGLSHGVMILGSIGTGKTSSLLLPIVEQVFGYKPHDWSGRPGGLILEVKSDFCHQVLRVLTALGRRGDYMEVGYNSNLCYNPLHGNAESTTLAYRLISVLRIIGGRVGSKDAKFWDEAAQSYATFLIHIHRLLYDYVTLRDLYIAASNPDVIEGIMKKAEAALEKEFVLVSKDDYVGLPEKVFKQLELFGPDATGEQLRLEMSDALLTLLDQQKIPYTRSGITDTFERREAYASAKLYYKTLKKLSQEMQTNIAVTLSVALQPFDMDLQARRIFCPAKAAYDPILNRDGRHGRPLPPFRDLIETPAVLALALPGASEELIARIAGVMLKQDWQRAVLGRKTTPGWNPESARHQVLAIDEYHLLATVGGAQPGGDEKFLNLCRDVKCLPLVATQSLSSLRETVGHDAEPVITQAFQNTISGRQKDEFTAEWLSRMVGPKDVVREHWGVSEGQSNVVAPMMGGLVAPTGSMNLSRGWNEQKDSIFSAKAIHELPTGVAVACIYDGLFQLPPTLVFLQPQGGDHAISWFKRNAKRLKAKGGSGISDE